MNQTHPDDITMNRYLALLREVILDTRAQAYHTQPQIAALMHAVEKVPDLLCEWPESKEDVLQSLESYEKRYLAGNDRYTRILRSGPRDDWQLRWDW